jgi:hypothetical protein
MVMAPPRPLPLRDTSAVAGFDNVDPLVQWHTGGNAAGADATGISDAARYGLNLKNSGTGGLSFNVESGDGTKSFTVRNSGITLGGGITVSGAATFADAVTAGSLLVTGAAVVQGAVNVGASIDVTGVATFRSTLTASGVATFGTGVTVGGTLGVTGAATFATGVTVGGALGVTGLSTFMSAVTIIAGPGAIGIASGTITLIGASNDQSFFLKHNGTAGQVSLGASNSTSPSLVAKNNTGTQLFTALDAGAFIVGQATTAVSTELFLVSSGASIFQGLVTISTGGLTIQTGGAGITGNSFFSNNLGVTGTLTVTNAVISGSARRISGPYGDGTIANRPMFQDNSGTSFTFVGALPPSGGTIAGFAAYNNADPASSSTIQVYMNGTASGRVAVANDGGGNLPLEVIVGGAVRAVVETNGNLTLCATAGSYGTGASVIFIGNRSAAPSANPTGGGILYSAAGAGTWRGSSGTTTTFGPADPHCPECGRDFAWEWQNDLYGHLQICAWCFTKNHQRGVIIRDPGPNDD